MCSSRPEVVARTTSVTGGDLVLRRSGDDWEVIANGVFLMDTRDGRSERLLVTAALDRVAGDHLQVVLGGLGLGTSLVEALTADRVSRVTVIEHEPALLAWHASLLRDLTGDALADPRTEVVVADAVTWLQSAHAADVGPVDALCLDVDNGPDWLVTPGNGWLYADAGVARCTSLLRVGGVLAHWSAAPSDALHARLARHLIDVASHQVATPRGAPDTILLGTRPP